MRAVVFTLTSARSGTLFLKSIFQKNVRACVCRHEPFFDWGNPTMFGPAIYDAYSGRWDRVRARLEKKRAYIQRLNCSVYIESSHAFLKSAYVAALDVFPDLRLIHLIRDPMKVAKSEAYRQRWRERVHAPFHFYRGEDGQRHFAWALTGNEEIFQSFKPGQLTLFQWCLLQWIEIENRAMRFLDENDLRSRSFTLQTNDLNEAAKVRAMFDFLGFELCQPELQLQGRKNKSFGGKTVITPEDRQQAADVLEQLPGDYLEIFQREPYVNHGWSAPLRCGEIVKG
jgi:hypothetical protein